MKVHIEDGVLVITVSDASPSDMLHSMKSSLLNVLSVTDVQRITEDDMYFYCQLLKAMTLDTPQSNQQKVVV